MKKVLLVLLSVLSLVAQARENITIIIGFGSADNYANIGRTLAEEANKIQDRYNFIFDVKPGAGQVIAYNYVKNTPNVIFQTGSAFWIRPYLYPKDSYNIHEMRTIVTECSVPFAVGSVTYSSWDSVPKDKPLTVATSGLGVISHLVALQLQKKYPQMIVVPYKTIADAVMASVSGHVDFVVAFIGDMEKFEIEKNGRRMTILGVTGTKAVGKYPTLSSNGFSSILDRANSQSSLMVPTSWNDEKAKEIRKILLQAETTKPVRDAYEIDRCIPFQIPENKLQSWWEEQNETWGKLTNGVKVDQ